MDIGSDYGLEWKNTRIPTIEEILQLCRGQIGIYLDLKEPHIAELVEIIKKYEMERDVFWCISASGPEGIEKLMEVKRLCYKCVPMPDPGEEKNIGPVIELVHPRVLALVMNDFSEAYVKTAHAENVKVFVDEKRGTEKEWAQILDWGTNGIQTNDPESLIRFLKERNK
jgi:glycerophosphoryl diester phosphodiesterase